MEQEAMSDGTNLPIMKSKTLKASHPNPPDAHLKVINIILIATKPAAIAPTKFRK